MSSRFRPPPLPSLLAAGIFAVLHASAAAAGPETGQVCAAYPLLQRQLAPAPAAAAATRARADHVASADGVSFRLDGDVRLDRDGNRLRADTVNWNNATSAWQASGGVIYQSPTLILGAEAMDGTATPRRGHAANVTYQLLESRGNGRAREAQLEPDQHARLSDVSYSSCPPSARSWELRAKRIDIDQKAEVGHARDVTMRLGDVPILWLPYLRFPTSDKRKSGALYPTLGYSDNRGLDITLPWYLNLAPNYDATLYPRLLGRRGLMLGVEFRYLTNASAGQLRVDYLPHDRVADESRTLWRARSHTRLGADWSFDVDINHVSDRSYFEDLGNAMYRSATQLLRSSVYLNGHGQWWNAAIGADRYQITDPDLPGSLEPYQRLPRALFRGELPLVGNLYAGLDGEFVSFHKDHGLDGRRLDLTPFIELPLQGAFWHFKPRLGYRYTGYHLDRDADRSPNRATPIASLDAGLVFERPTHFGGAEWTQTLEPRAYYLRVPYRDQSDIPIFDTSAQAFDFWQLFSSNRFAGADRQMDANNLTVALTSRLLDGNGVERMSASVGRIRYFDPQRIAMPGHPATDFYGSAWVGQFSAALNADWRFHVAEQWNPAGGGQNDLTTIALQRLFDGDGVFNASYRYRRGYLKQFDISTVYPLNPNWRLVARWNYAIDLNKTLEALAGFEYDSCCVAVRLLGRHFVHNSRGDTDNGVLLEIEFKGLGAFGQRAGDFLGHAILGYRPIR